MQYAALPLVQFHSAGVGGVGWCVQVIVYTKREKLRVF